MNRARVNASRHSSSALASLLGCLVLLGCEKQEPEEASAPAADSSSLRVGSPELPAELTQKTAENPEPEASAAPAAPPAPTSWSSPPSFPPDYKGAWFAVTALGAGVYVEPSFGTQKIGYLRAGSRIPIAAEPVSKKNCTSGWYAVGSGGFVCGNLGTTSLDHPEVKFGARQPDLTQTLPYPYARNAKNGTPLYRNVPSREQMDRYEPYLREKKEEKAKESAESRREPASTPTAPRPSSTTPPLTIVRSMDDRPAGGAAAPAPTTPPATPGLAADGSLITASVAVPEPAPEVPWWQQENIKERLHEVTLDHLEADADEVLAKRMVTGFYVAVDKTFRWNGRGWYKTTKGLIAPTDRFWQTTASEFRGAEVDGDKVKLPLGWVYGGRKSTGTYKIDPDTKRIDNAGTLERFARIQLTGRALEVRGTHYEEIADGTWVKRAHIRVTAPGPLPAGLAEGERWIDVNLKTQTLIAFVGDKPVYATLISSGRESKIKAKDHRTPIGEWRIREKHITSTMDGDGTAAGDLPYSIEDVPFSMFYHRAYAIHGAFWHSNYGNQMSHGCVNLSPLDSKYLFFFAGPQIPAGFHGVFASESNPGTRVVVHE